jgi:hypothetical protein
VSKRLIKYFKANWMTTMKKHIDVGYLHFTIKLTKEMNNTTISPLEIRPSEKRFRISSNINFNYFGCVNLFKKDRPQQ